MRKADEDEVKQSLLDANKELRNKDKIIESLRFELSNMNTWTEKMSGEQNNLKTCTVLTEGLLSDTKKRVVELELEVEARKESEAKLLESFVAQTKQLEEAALLLEKSKLEVTALNEKMQEVEEEYGHKYEAAKEVIDRLGHQLQLERESSIDANSRNKSESVETQTLFDDIDMLKNELKQAMEAEEKSKKAMDDFALVLKEVTLGSNHTKEKLKATEEQLEVVTEEAANLKKMLQSTEQASEAFIKELKTDRDRLSNTVKRLRLEAEESVLAWNEKEVEFVNCIKKAEDEKIGLEEENKKLEESRRETEEMSLKLKDEIKKLRDVLKQAVSEANMAKEARNLARAENTYLRDFIEEKDRAIVSLAHENEYLRMNGAEADKNTKKLSSTLNFDQNQCRPKTPKSTKNIEDNDIGASAFDILKSSTKEGEAYDGNNMDDVEQVDDMDLDRSPQGKSKALIRRFGDLLRRTKFSSAQGSISKDMAQPQKEITV